MRRKPRLNRGWWGAGGFAVTLLVGATMMVGVFSCTSSSPDPSVSGHADPLSLPSLWSAAYRVDALGDTAVRLVDGSVEDTRPDGGVRFRARLRTVHARGDLDADGKEEAAVVLESETGGSGVFVDLVVFTADGSGPRQLEARFLGDRVQVESLSLENGSVIVVLLTHDDEDPLCCPTRSVVRRFVWEADTLEETELPYRELDLSDATAEVRRAAERGEAWVSDPLQVALRTVRPPGGGSGDIARRSAAGELPRRVELVIVERGLLDDSTRSRRVEITVEKDPAGLWLPTRARTAWSCWPGRGHGYFAATPCS
jgi:hypothetical protein